MGASPLKDKDGITASVVSPQPSVRPNSTYHRISSFVFYFEEVWGEAFTFIGRDSLEYRNDHTS